MTETSLGFPLETVTVFIVLAVLAIALDLFSHRKDQPLSLKNAIFWSLFWILIALVFAGFLYVHHGAEISSLFLTGYVLEKALSVDNLFVIMAVFSWFGIPEGYRHRVLYWGIIGAMIFRGIFVAIGTGLLALGPYIECVFAIIVAWTAIMMFMRMGRDDEETEDFSNHLAYRLVKRFFPLWPKLVGHHFFLSQKQVNVELAKPENKAIQVGRGKHAWLYATPLFLCLAIIELSDVMFAFDSVPAIIAISREPLIVYSAMMFAILGLRSLYFVLEVLKQHLVYLEKAVVCLLFFIAFKLGLDASKHLLGHGYSISATLSLYIVLGVLATGLLASLLFPPKTTSTNQHDLPRE